MYRLPLMLICCGLFIATSAHAERVYQYRDTSGQVLFTDKSIMPQRYHLESVRNFSWHFDARPLTAAQRNRYDKDILLAAKRYSISPALIKAVIHAESHFNVHAESSAGAQGLMQLMPATAKSLQVKSVFNARQNILGGSKYLSILENRFSNLDKVLAAYNAGPSNVERYNGIPPFPETRRYVAKVKELLPRYRKQFSSHALLAKR